MRLEGPPTTLNGICPYLTMFPLEFPLKVLRSRARRTHRVLDPFCGRGTTNFAARLLGLESLGVDSSPVAVAITASKLVRATVQEIVAEARAILDSNLAALVPKGKFWRWGYHPEVLNPLCRLRRALLDDCSTPTRIALRGIILGALHGPKQKAFAGYFSNQCPRTYAPKPAYAAKFWQSRGLTPEPIDVLEVIRHRAQRFFATLPASSGSVRLSDSRRPESLVANDDEFDWVITSPPYYGMRTYVPDQWLRYWFLGGPERVDYTNNRQLSHSSPDEFAKDLRAVWQNAAAVCHRDATLLIRFGGISHRKGKPLDLLKDSLTNSGWTLRTIRYAGSATDGKRQADAFLRSRGLSLMEWDAWATKRTKGLRMSGNR